MEKSERKGGQQVNRLRYYKDIKSMTSEELAKASGISQIVIYFIESGLSSNPTKSTKQKLSRALKIPILELFPPRRAQRYV